MSERIADLEPSLIRPIAMPATGFWKGAPASISAIEAEQTEPIEEDPLDSSVSQTMRIVYGNFSYEGIIALIERSASAPCPSSRRELPPIRPVSPTLNGGKL